MNPERLTFVTALLSGAVGLVCLAVFVLLREATYRDLVERVSHATRTHRDAAVGTQGARTSLLMPLLHRLGEKARANARLYSEQDVAALEGTIAAAGYNPRKVLPLVLGAKLAILLLVPFASVIVCATVELDRMQQGVIIGIGLAIAVLGPDWTLRLLRRRYTAALQRGIADALDLLVVCAEAGMGLEAAIEQVAQETRPANPAMASALSMLVDELRVLPDRREAFLNFGRRSGVDGIRRMATILNQSLEHGTSLGQALRAIANELRRERMLRLEEKAARLPALLVGPLILFILPPLLIVLVGGPLLQLMDTLHAAILHMPSH